MRVALPFTLLCILLACVPARARQQQQQQAPPGSAVICKLCPTIAVTCPETTMFGTPATFKVKVAGAGPSPSLTFRWTTSAGTFTSDPEGVINTPDGERAIVVDTTGVSPGSPVMVTFEAGGLDRSCMNYGSCTTTVSGGRDPHPIDYYGDIRFEDEKARLDNFAIELQDSPDFHGYIDCYGGRVGRRGEARSRCERAKRYLTGARGIAPDRIVLVDGGFRERLNVGLWLLPPGTNFPGSPTVDPSEVVFTDAKRRPRRRPARKRN